MTFTICLRTKHIKIGVLQCIKTLDFLLSGIVREGLTRALAERLVLPSWQKVLSQIGTSRARVFVCHLRLGRCLTTHASPQPESHDHASALLKLDCVAILLLLYRFAQSSSLELRSIIVFYIDICNISTGCLYRSRRTAEIVYQRMNLSMMDLLPVVYLTMKMERQIPQSSVSPRRHRYTILSLLIDLAKQIEELKFQCCHKLSQFHEYQRQRAYRSFCFKSEVEIHKCFKYAKKQQACLWLCDKNESKAPRTSYRLGEHH